MTKEMTPREREARRIRRATKNAVLYGITITSFDVILVGLSVDTPPVWLLVGVLMSVLWIALFYIANATSVGERRRDG